MTTDLTTGRPARLIVRFTLPLLAGNLFQQLYSLVDAAVVGRTLGVDALAAVGATGGLTFLLLGFTWGMTGGLAIPVAHAFGAGDARAVRRLVAGGALVAAAGALVITAFAVPAAGALLTALHTPAQLLDDATTFAVVTFGGVTVTMAFNYLSAVIRALGDSRTPLWFLIGSCVANAGLVVLFVAVLGWGVAGAAAATLVAQGLAVVACLVLIARRIPALRLRREDWAAVRRADVREPARIGLPMGLQMSIIAIGALALQLAINGLGARAVAAYTVAMRVDQLAIAPLASFGLAIATFVAQNRGALAWARIRQGVARTTAMAAGVALAVGALTILAGPSLVRAFVGAGQQDVVAMGQTYFLVNGPLYAAVAVLFVLRNALQGLGLSGVPTLAGVLELVARTTAALLLVGPLGFVGVAAAAPLAWFAALTPVLLAWSRRRRIMAQDERAMQGRVEAPALDRV